MKENRVLFEINLLDKLIAREMFVNCFEDDIMPLYASQLKIMDYIIKHNGEEIYQKDLEQVLNLRRATVSGVLQTMEKHYLISRVASKDARMKIIVLSDKAKKRFVEAEDRLLELEKNLLLDITQDELDMLVCLIKKMQDNLINYHNEK